MEYPILICLTFVLLHSHFPTLLGTSAKATAVCLFLGFLSFIFPLLKNLLDCPLVFPAGGVMRMTSDTNA
jgi:hypothetical protein